MALGDALIDPEHVKNVGLLSHFCSPPSLPLLPLSLSPLSLSPLSLPLSLPPLSPPSLSPLSPPSLSPLSLPPLSPLFPLYVQIVPGYADLLYNIGMADFNESAFIKSCTDKAVNYIQNKQFKDAFDVSIGGVWIEFEIHFQFHFKI